MHLGLMYAALVATGAIPPDGRPVPAPNPGPRPRNHHAKAGISPEPVGDHAGLACDPEGLAGCSTGSTIEAIAS
ncbi:hypothetical protein AB1L88_21995 [Tautonia sp. JC769]|uniref:hypothetical protein n=1 Tax=Tautonia sp. JC769 TaxID=3232135 RepID=UPI003458D8F4